MSVKTLTLELDKTAWASRVLIDGAVPPDMAALVELVCDPATGRSGLRVQLGYKTYVLTGKITMEIETETLLEPDADFPIYDWHRIRQFAERHAPELLALERSIVNDAQAIGMENYERRVSGL